MEHPGRLEGVVRGISTVPVGLGVGKVVKLGRLPVKVQLSLQYMPVRPRNTCPTC
jgi:hypothetical protein